MSERKPEQGVGGTTHSTDLEHVAWISWFVTQHQYLRGMCLSACHDMLEKFPELKLVRGHVINPKGIQLLEDVYMDPGDGHWWLETQGGKIVDPTRLQFGSEDDGQELRYVAFDECKSSSLPTGKCPNDGWYCYRNNYFCSWDCELEFKAYMQRECGGVFVTPTYLSVCPNSDCRAKDTEPVPAPCRYCETPMVGL